MKEAMLQIMARGTRDVTQEAQFIKIKVGCARGSMALDSDPDGWRKRDEIPIASRGVPWEGSEGETWVGDVSVRMVAISMSCHEQRSKLG